MPVNLLTPLDYSSKNLDHLGIVATVCKEIGLADEIKSIGSLVWIHARK